MSGKPLASADRRPSEFDTEIQPLRARVDAIDAQLLSLLNERAAVVADIYELKTRHGVPRFDRARTGAARRVGSIAPARPGRDGVRGGAADVRPGEPGRCRGRRIRARSDVCTGRDTRGDE